jgi:hypothetical protein
VLAGGSCFIGLPRRRAVALYPDLSGCRNEQCILDRVIPSGLMKPCLLLVTIVAAVFAQQKSAPKTPAPEVGYVVAPQLFKDAGCLRDYLKAQAAEGLERRRALSDLLQYGCVEKTVDAIYWATVKETKRIISGSKQVSAKRVVLIVDADKTSMITHHEVDYDVTPLGREGWVLADQILHLDDQQMEATIRELLKAK